MYSIKKFETFFYEKNTHNISCEDNKRLVSYVDENLMFDFKDNDITYNIYGHFDGNYQNYKGLIVQIFRHDNNENELGACFNGRENCVIYDDACPLYPYIVKLHQKVSSIIQCQLDIKSDTTVITIMFSFMDSKVNI